MSAADAVLDQPSAAIDVGGERLKRFVAEVSTYQASFAQTLLDEYGEELERAAGTVALAKPGKFRWQYETPYRQTIVTNGQILWTYDEDLEQVTVNPLPPERDSSPLGLLVDDVDIERRYEIVSRTIDGDIHWLALTPKGGNPEYQKIEIALSPTDIVAMRLFDNLNQVTALTFERAVRDADIDPALFEFEIPAGVDVVNGVTR